MIRQHLQIICLGIAIAGLAIGSGCKMAAPIHVWKGPKVPQGPVVKVAVGPVGVASRAHRTSDPTGGELQQVATRLQEALQVTLPPEGSNLIAFHPPELERASVIQLASFDNQPNDSATLGAARSLGTNYVLQGNIFDARLEVKEEPAKRFSIKRAIFGEKKVPEFLTVHWVITDVESGQRVAEEMVHMDIDQAQIRFHDLGYHVPGNDGRVLMASSRAAWELVAAVPARVETVLELPWFWAGSSQVRKGNGYAVQGRWDLAEKEWQNVADKHPTNKAAWHNLALASVANENFELAWSRIRHANDYWPGDSSFETQLWIEKKQRDYHAAMGLPPPEGGWKFPDATIANVKENYFKPLHY